MPLVLAPTKLGQDIQPGDWLGRTEPWQVQSVKALPSPEGACTDIARAPLGLCQCHSPAADLTAMPVVEVTGTDGTVRRLYAHIAYGIGSATPRRSR